MCHVDGGKWWVSSKKLKKSSGGEWEKKKTFFTTPPQAVEGNLLKVWGYQFAFVHLCFCLTSSAVSAIFKLLHVTLRLLNEQTLSWRDFKFTGTLPAIRLQLCHICRKRHILFRFGEFWKPQAMYLYNWDKRWKKKPSLSLSRRVHYQAEMNNLCTIRYVGLKYFLHFAKSLWVLGLSSKLLTEQ